ncbi:MAG: protoporphyrinogen oxidase, partial [Bdellovibrionales bacterium]|nr:protoporphyrinogen oxidase [Bdellovibrionales bacterium]
MGAGSFDAIIVGAGIGGLTLAHKLHQGGQRVLVLEKSASVGGWAQSNPIDGFLCEGGPNSTFATPQVIELIKQIGLEDDLCLAGPPSKRRFILLRRGAGRSSLLEVPGTFRTAVNSPLLNWQEKLRLAAEPLMPQSGLDDESVGAFARRRFGKGFTEKVLAPALSGIWAADIDRLSVRSALQRLFDFERNSGSVLRGALSTRKQPRRKRGETISFTAGMQQLAISLAGTLPADTVRCGCSVQRLKYDQNGVRVFAGTAEAASQQFNAKQLILTCDNISTAKLIEDAAPALAERIKEVPYSPMGVIHVSWNLDALDNFPGGFGFLATPTKGKPLLGALFNSA